MLNDDKYFNQLILSDDTIQGIIQQYTKGFDIDKICELINLEIKNKHKNSKTFHGTIEYKEDEGHIYNIEYARDYKKGNGGRPYSGYFNKNEMYSLISIDLNDTNLCFICGDFIYGPDEKTIHLEISRKNKDEDSKLTVYFYTEKEELDVSEERDLFYKLSNKKNELSEEEALEDLTLKRKVIECAYSYICDFWFEEDLVRLPAYKLDKNFTFACFEDKEYVKVKLKYKKT